MRVVASARAFLFVKVMQETNKPLFRFSYFYFYNRHTFKVILYNVFRGEWRTTFSFLVFFIRFFCMAWLFLSKSNKAFFFIIVVFRHSNLFRYWKVPFLEFLSFSLFGNPPSWPGCAIVDWMFQSSTLIFVFSHCYFEIWKFTLILFQIRQRVWKDVCKLRKTIPSYFYVFGNAYLAW